MSKMKNKMIEKINEESLVDLGDSGRPGTYQRVDSFTDETRPSGFFGLAATGQYPDSPTKYWVSVDQEWRSVLVDDQGIWEIQ